MKKAQGLSLNTIIIAAIVLIVMIVLWAIFTGRMGGFSRGVDEQEAMSQMKALQIAAEAKGGGCVPAVICGEIDETSSQNCIAMGCMRGLSKDDKCIGRVPEAHCSSTSSTSSCESLGICKWVGTPTP